MFSRYYFSLLANINRTFCLKSAVLFFFIFCLSACEPVQSPPVSDKTDIVTENLLTEKVHSRELLTRGVYNDLLLNPHQVMNTEQAVFLQDLLEGLTAYDTTGQVVPAIAESWKTEDYKTWFFTLRDNAKWSNGDPVTAQDFVASWQQLALSHSHLKSYLGFLNLAHSKAIFAGEMSVTQLGIEAMSPRILRIQLDKAMPQLPAMLTHVALLPHYQKQTEQFVSNGAYRFIAQQGDVIHLEKNPYYWANEKASFKFVDYQKIAETQSVSHLDMVTEPKQVTSGLQYFPKLCTYYYEFNFNDPLLQKSAVRKALISMISSGRIVHDILPEMRVATHFLPSSMQEGNELPWEPVVVEQVLAQHGITEKSPLQLKLTYDQENRHTHIAQRLIRMWSLSDMIRVSSEPVSWQQLLEKRATGDFQLIRSGWCADYNDPAAFLQMFYSQAPDNKMGYHNAEVDQLLEATLSVQTEHERKIRYAQIAQRLQQDSVVLPIFQYVTPMFIHPTVMGYQLDNPTGVIYSKDVYRKIASH